MTWTSPHATPDDRAIIRTLDAIEDAERAGCGHDEAFWRDWTAAERRERENAEKATEKKR